MDDGSGGAPAPPHTPSAPLERFAFSVVIMDGGSRGATAPTHLLLASASGLVRRSSASPFSRSESSLGAPLRPPPEEEQEKEGGGRGRERRSKSPNTNKSLSKRRSKSPYE